MGAVFNDAAERTLSAALRVCTQRGGEYQDSWALENMASTFLDATLRRFSIVLGPYEKRLLIMAALVDVKDSRLTGPWKNDSVLDGINYRAAYAALRDDYEALVDAQVRREATASDGQNPAVVDGGSMVPEGTTDENKVIDLDAARAHRAAAKEEAAAAHVDAHADAHIPCPFCNAVFRVGAGHACHHPQFGTCSFEGVLTESDDGSTLVLGWRKGDELYQTLVGRPKETS